MVLNHSKMCCRSLFYWFSSILFVLTILGQDGHTYMVGLNPHHLRETVDSEGTYQMEWRVDWTDKVVIFHLTVQTKGYIGFGLSKNGEMAGADIVIGGVDSHGKSYFGDYHGIGDEEPVLDATQDWNFISASENGTHTMLAFSRPFDTCDPQDYSITEDQIVIIWAIGTTNEIVYHEENRGTFHTYLLTPDYSPQIITEAGTGVQRALDSSGRIDPSVKVWTVERDMPIPPQETLYWCTIHKTPRLRRTSQLIGLNVRLHDEASRTHLHHMLINRCRVPLGNNAPAAFMFDRFTLRAGDNCLTVGDPTQEASIPIQYCTELNHVYAIGGRAHFHPPNVGLAFESEEYYMVQIHLNNPQLLTDSRLNASLDFFYTENIRPTEGGILSVRHVIPGLSPSFLIPPNAANQQIRGICGTECTNNLIPPEGITLYGAHLHTHNTGRILRVRHFRGNMELPFIIIDENYYPSFQPVRNFHTERKVMPGDQLVAECVHDSTQANGTVVGGFSVSQEMCAMSLLHYVKLRDIIYCDSQITNVEDREYFLAGVGNITWSVDRLEYVVDPGQPLAGKTVTEVSNNYVDWSPERRENFVSYHLYRPHMNRCQPEFWTLGTNATPSLEPGVLVTFPSQIKPYEREDACVIGHYVN